jgi:hypothetical protein
MFIVRISLIHRMAGVSLTTVNRFRCSSERALETIDFLDL